MAIIKCKMCGGDLILRSNSTLAECEYCGTMQTVPSADNEKKLTLFARANRLRMACEFDKATGVYEAVVADFPEEAEAYWCLVLCKYGIEYVDDPASGKKVPTCHRSSFDSVMDDSNFEQALENADVIARKVYREEAKKIETIRKGIIEISSKEDSYDIFICYKETDLNGDRTLDSVLAQDIYNSLTENGYRVFFSRITLEDKLGQEYEPYIFAALNSAKVMLAVGTDYEHYNAVWVKNEWSRFMHMIAAGQKKTLIPCYKNIDAYDMPKEFAKLQAQDLGKIGATQDLLRGIEKIIPKQPKITKYIPTGTPGVDSLLRRGQLFLEDSDWKNAATYFERVLDIDPEHAEAYALKSCAYYESPTIKQLVYNQWPSLAQHADFKRAIRFADSTFADLLKGLIEEAENVAKQRVQQIETTRAKKKQRLGETRERIAAVQNRFVSSRGVHTVGLKSDGTVLTVGNNRYGQNAVQNWSKIIAVSSGWYHIVGLRFDGTVVAVGDNKEGQCDVSHWSGMKQIRAGTTYTLGLKNDGTVTAVGKNYAGQTDVSHWKDIVEIDAYGHSVGLKADGTVVATGDNKDGACDITAWTDIVAISAGQSHTVGLKSDGTVVAVGNNQAGQCNVGKWTEIVAVKAGRYSTIALRADGTVVATGNNSFGQLKVAEWTDIVAVDSDGTHSVGLKNDGTFVVVGKDEYNLFGIKQWKLFKSLDSIEADWQAESDIADQKCRRVVEKKQLEEARCREEKERKIAYIARLNNERESLLIERSQLKGLFSGKRRNEIDARISQIERQIKEV